jgi:hypothetical protein
LLSPGTKLGPYEIASMLGAGGMGEVYQAHDTKLGRDVAIKVLPEVFSRDPERLSRFQREAKMLAALNHPNIVKPLFETRATGTRYEYDVSADSQRFLINTAPEQAASAPITVVVNWTAGLKK